MVCLKFLRFLGFIIQIVLSISMDGIRADKMEQTTQYTHAGSLARSNTNDQTFNSFNDEQKKGKLK